MNIGLMGCEFSSSNKGCEALTYSIISILKDIIDEKKEITIYNFSGTELGEIPNFYKDVEFINISPKLRGMTSSYIKALKNCDVILDVTMGDSFSDIYSYKYYKVLIHLKRMAERFCKKYILLPQTYGPFKHFLSSFYAKSVLKKAQKIYARDELSKNIVEEKLMISNVELASDMAFTLPYDFKKYNIINSKVKIGINVSGLLYKGGFNNSNQFGLKLNYKEYVEQLLNYFSQDDKYEVHLIPHVINLSDETHDDDYQTCKMLSQQYNNVVLAPAFTNPIDAKSYISNMNVFIGSRMHSTIASFSSNVATIPVAYSRKFQGLFESLNYKYIVDCKTLTTKEAFDKTIELVNKKDELKTIQNESMKIIEKKNIDFKNSLKKEILNEL